MQIHLHEYVGNHLFIRSIFLLTHSVSLFLILTNSPAYPLTLLTHINIYTRCHAVFLMRAFIIQILSTRARTHTRPRRHTRMQHSHTTRARVPPFLPTPLSILHSRMDSLESSEAADRFFGTHRAQSRHDKTRKSDVIGHYLLLFCSSLYIRSNSCVYVYMRVCMVRMSPFVRSWLCM